MSTDDQDRQEIDELRAQVAALTVRLDAMQQERDEAIREMERLRNGVRNGATDGREATGALDAACEFCDGEGRYWVHDFEMVCRRCGGTGIRPKQAV